MGKPGGWVVVAVVAGLRVAAPARVVPVPEAGAGVAVAGTYTSKSGMQSFVVTEREGRWGMAIEIPGLGALNTGGDGEVSAVSCGPAGNCAVGGYYKDGTLRSDSEGGDGNFVHHKPSLQHTSPPSRRRGRIGT